MYYFSGDLRIYNSGNIKSNSNASNFSIIWPKKKKKVYCKRLNIVLFQMETSAVTIHEALKVILDYQTHHRLREAQGRAFAEELNEGVQLWSIGEAVVILFIGVGQVLVLRSFFVDRKTAVKT